MTSEIATTRLDVRAFAQTAGQLNGREALSRYPRVAQECDGTIDGIHVIWSAQGEMRADPVGGEAVWLHLEAGVAVPMVCQRCLAPVEVPLRVERAFRFVANEETAAAQDDDVEEDLLVFEVDFNLHELIEDELVLALPLIPKHEVCPGLPPPASGAEFGVSVAGRPNPFAVLAAMKPGRNGKT